jgi:hypothetical protein
VGIQAAQAVQAVLEGAAGGVVGAASLDVKYRLKSKEAVKIQHILPLNAQF